MAESESKYELISRKEAKARELKFYFTGKPCGSGHLSPRYVGNNICYQCATSNAEQRTERRRATQRRWYAANPDKAKAKRKRHYEKHRETLCRQRRERYAKNREREFCWTRAYVAKNREKVAAKQRISHAAYYRKHQERIKAKSARWYSENRERALQTQSASSKRWWRNNPLKRRQYNHSRRAKVKRAKGSYTTTDIRDLFQKQGGKCVYCALELRDDFHVDHVTPISAGGSNEKANLQLLCRTCNLRKWKHDPVQFARSLGLLL